MIPFLKSTVLLLNQYFDSLSSYFYDINAGRKLSLRIELFVPEPQAAAFASSNKEYKRVESA